ncbi:hypothetical protein [Blastopirellula marina]|uniref:Uncharacterized protein n=1 Tax=Blastopirellula marina DSM 3645 TaxID=314230 RepID=A3ZTN3_9BACT|nr:hypothetical protein [Blastopirellula marina]EAQ80299.1 hypothetical protein DSM3645_19923 [Blastopirellula marina DSM 3645]
MFIHYHSLYAGIIAYAILLLLGVPVFVGVLGIAVSLGTEYEQLKVRLKKNDRAYTFAVASFLQASALFLAYAILYAIIYGRASMM